MSDGKVLVTGAAGFIGSHVAARLAELRHDVAGCDNFNAYYDPSLKEERVAHLLTPRGVACSRVELADEAAVFALFEATRPRVVVHLAAQAGVRHSIEHPQAYVQSNLVAFGHVLEACRRSKVEHLVYASSSSVYGGTDEIPFTEGQATDRPVSLYAATKKANELMAHAYGQVHGLRATGLRFFTVYGPWGRPDMAYFSFAERIVAGRPLPIFAEGKLLRDFTYIDDVVEGVVRIATAPAPLDGASEIFNIGNHRPVSVLAFVAVLSAALGREARLEFLPMQPGDVRATAADVTKLRERVGFEPDTPLEDGLAAFVEWFVDWKTRRGEAPPAVVAAPR
jgi:UDP-glucuronate 4-epimerase